MSSKSVTSKRWHFERPKSFWRVVRNTLKLSWKRGGPLRTTAAWRMRSVVSTARLAKGRSWRAGQHYCTCVLGTSSGYTAIQSAADNDSKVTPTYRPDTQEIFPMRCAFVTQTGQVLDGPPCAWPWPRMELAGALVAEKMKRSPRSFPESPAIDRAPANYTTSIKDESQSFSCE